MAITQGLWNVAGINLPDFGLSEKLGIAPNAAQYNSGSLNNDAFSQQTNQNYNALQSIPQQVGTTVNGTTTYKPNPAYTTAAAQNTATNVSRMANVSANNNDWRSLPGYAGWDPVAAAADFAKTGGAGKGGSTGGTTAPTVNKYSSTTGDTRANAIVNNPSAAAEFEASGMNMDEYLSSIDQEANAQNAMLGGYEQTANADKLAAEQNLAGQTTQLKGTAQRGKEDALSAARRLYSELQQGYKQRFGGASSAGEAAMALTGNEQQRQMAQTNRGYQDTINQIDQQAVTALNTVQSEFRSRLDQINQNRTLVESQRLQARRSALQDLANKAYAIKQQQDAFKTNILSMMAQQDAGAGRNISSYLNINPTSTLTPGAVATQASGNQGLQTVQNSVGKISSGTMSNEDRLRQLGLIR